MSAFNHSNTKKIGIRLYSIFESGSPKAKSKPHLLLNRDDPSLYVEAPLVADVIIRGNWSDMNVTQSGIQYVALLLLQFSMLGKTLA